MEYEDVLVQGDERAAGASYRLFDEHGQVLALRSDMTIPLARLVATRYPDADLPLRLCYVSHAYRAVRPQRGQQREFLQAGIELIGAEAPTGTVDVLEVLCAALDAGDLPRARIGLGDAGLFRGLLQVMGVNADDGKAAMEALERHDLVELEQRVDAMSITPERKRALVSLPQLRGDADVIERAIELGGDDIRGPFSRLAEVATGLDRRGLADRVIFDLGLVRDLGYYTGAIFEVYDPALGHVIGGGGRYDELLGRFGRSAARVWVRALRGADARRPGRGGATRRGGPAMNAAGEPLRIAVPRGALFAETLDLLDRVGIDTAALRSDSRSLLFPGDRVTIVTMRPERRPHLRRGRRRRSRHHGQGRADGAARARGLRAARPRIRLLPHGGRDPRRRSLRRRPRAPPGRAAHRDQVPADRDATTSSPPAARPR